MGLLTDFRNYIATIDDVQIKSSQDDRIDFSTGGLNYFFIADENSQYFRLFLPRVDNYRSDLSGKLNRFNLGYKAGKAFVLDESVWFVFEHFILDSEKDGRFVFSRALSVLKKMIEDWRSEGETSSQ